MKIINYVFLFSILFAFIVLIIIMSIGYSPCFSQDFVEEYISKYSKDFTFLNNKSYTLGINGFTESSETDWYFHDNELDFAFHVKHKKVNIHLRESILLVIIMILILKIEHFYMDGMLV